LVERVVTQHGPEGPLTMAGTIKPTAKNGIAVQRAEGPQPPQAQVTSSASGLQGPATSSKTSLPEQQRPRLTQVLPSQGQTNSVVSFTARNPLDSELEIQQLPPLEDRPPLRSATSATAAVGGSKQTSYVEPKAEHGLRHRLRGLLLEDSGWRELKDQMKQTALDTQWQEFRKGNPHPRAAIASALQPFVDAVEPGAARLVRKATQYADRKARQTQYTIHRDNGQISGRKFYNQNTNLREDIRATPEGIQFRLPRNLDDVHRQTIFDQTGRHYQGSPALGSGVFGDVQIAEMLTPEGQRGRVVAAKIPRGSWEQRHHWIREAGIVKNTPIDPAFSDISEVYVGKRKAILLQELAIGGTLRNLLSRLYYNVGKITNTQKEDVKLWAAGKLIAALAKLHEGTPPTFHGDIHDKNVLVKPEASGATNLMVVDFGCARQPDGNSRKGEGQKQDRHQLAELLDGIAVRHSGWVSLIRQVRDPGIPLRDILTHECLSKVPTDAEVTALLERLG